MALRFKPFFPQPSALKPSQKWHIFISYRSSDRPWVLKLYDALRDLKYEVFLDQFVLNASAPLATSLDQGLAGSAGAIIVWSKSYQTSNWTQGEYNAIQALRRGSGGFGFGVATIDATPLEGLLAGDIFTSFVDQPDGPCGLTLLRLVLGLSNQPLPPGAVEMATEIDAARKRYLAQIRAARLNDDPDRLVELVQSDDEPWRDSPILGCEAADGLIAAKRYADADRVLEKLRADFPEAIRPRQLQALSARRRRNWRRAQDILGALYADNFRDTETVGMYAATWATRYDESRDRRHLLRSRDLYLEAFTSDPRDAYTGVNAASKSLFIGEPETASEIAARVEPLVANIARPGYYDLATLGELALLRRDYEKARRAYQAAILEAPGETGNQEVTRGQARKIMDALATAPADRARVEEVFAQLDAQAGGV